MEKWKYFYIRLSETICKVHTHIVIITKFILGRLPVIFTFFLIITGDYLTTNYVHNILIGTKQLTIRYIGIVSMLSYQICVTLLIASYLQLINLDPGSLQVLSCPKRKPPDADMKYDRTCTKCNPQRWKPLRAHHCSTCKTCIFKMDHHCIWINNCIGFSNQKLFILFLIYILICCIISLLSVFLLLYTLSITSSTFDLRDWTYINNIFILFNIIYSVIFGTAAFVFLLDQFEAIKSNTSLVETYQSVYGELQGFARQFTNIFGNNILLWILPIQVNNKPNFLENLYVELSREEIKPLKTNKSKDWVILDGIIEVNSDENKYNKQVTRLYNTN
ncbi:DHHC zinc finger domain-containing protein [Cryptosporidium muris RN66]|uniref:Palmitoyltransferase n=1 Tax=Cryptosporidium muris (strain RN66) TaxID=441375 RepID=B6A9V2_CRYMR|nr:DHHC zinc finger domain-containing protein [Cryptosporidium muris RN66]EEA04993.1 DHHC zinc finger domain-containing protein [Cryptosporidium muris RN66]|eukprot:XP_002139342.1 DHHC zinc finger domain-containing protein [Cryptosporidium muris RN66]